MFSPGKLRTLSLGLLGVLAASQSGTGAGAQPVERGWAVNHGLTKDRIIGLIDVSPHVVGPCNSDKPVTIELYDTPSTAKPPSGRIEVAVASQPPPGSPCAITSVDWRRAGAPSAEQALTEESGYEILALIAYERAGRWFRIALPRGSAWMMNRPGNFQRYPELLKDHLTHMAAGWDGKLWSTPGVSSARPVSSAVKRVIQQAKDAQSDVDVDVLAVRHVSGEPWIHVRVTDGHCRGADPVKIDTGWVPAHRPTHEPSVWFYSRGC